MALAESARRAICPALGNVLGGPSNASSPSLTSIAILSLPRAFEIGRGKAPEKPRPLHWNDSGTLRVREESSGAARSIPGKLGGRACAGVADERGATIIERCPVHADRLAAPPLPFMPVVHGRRLAMLRRKKSSSPPMPSRPRTHLLSPGRAEPKLTLAVLTEPMDEKRLEAIGPCRWESVLHSGSAVPVGAAACAKRKA